ncbi:flavin-dependent dehydrogenase [Saccharothrix tamanrassetensis]|uniref:Flavin-dependent dehydrogenase n=1 Tax=Saccharothrix tamanrassetensis TaxID=1051531 RepID=A0A841CCF2_9PSEU|nr:NAD(P)/FAD-dependent oxidoreductase [Saccharothrix tamanrassetensis]MBB5953857.1 flavin-dependent dehydrogenase [Saccharothrix tamanrassetensis]
MSAEPDLYDVVVIGGGPGGSMSGTLLSDFGKRVLILEAEKFPRYHIGESLLSGTADLLNRIGVLDRLESDGYIKKHGVEWVWGENRVPWTVYFKDALAMPYDYGYQVERGEFDKLLLDNAREHGCEVREQHRVTDFEIGEDGVSTVTFQNADGVSTTVRTRWIVDSSGQGGLVTKRLHEQHWDPYLKNLAVWTYWTGAERPPGLDAGNTFLPAFDEGWWWFIPLRDDITSVGMVVDSKVLHENRGKGMEAYYADCLARTPELAQRLAGAQRTDEIHVARDWSYTYDKFSGDGYIAVGDAACFIDPLFSTGVHLAMLSGFLAAVTVNTVLDRPEMDRDEVLAFYESTYRKEFERLRAQVYFLYGGHGSSKDSYFWHARSQFEVPEIEPEKAFISLIAGAFQHRSWYSRYLRQLEVPEELRTTIEKIFEGKSTGVGVDLHQPVVLSPDITYVDDLAVDGAYLRRARSVVTPSGTTLPVTPQLEGLFALVDGARTSAELVDELARGQAPSHESAQSLVHEAVSYGLLRPTD